MKEATGGIEYGQVSRSPVNRMGGNFRASYNPQLIRDVNLTAKNRRGLSRGNVSKGRQVSVNDDMKNFISGIFKN